MRWKNQWANNYEIFSSFLPLLPSLYAQTPPSTHHSRTTSPNVLPLLWQTKFHTRTKQQTKLYSAYSYLFIIRRQTGRQNILYRIPYLLIAWCRVLLEQLIGLQLVKKFPIFHGTRRFITALTSVRHLSLSWDSPIQSIYPHPTSWRSILILYTHLRLGLPSGLFPSGFPTKILYTPLSSPIHATCPAHDILLDYWLQYRWRTYDL